MIVGALAMVWLLLAAATQMSEGDWVDAAQDLFVVMLFGSSILAIVSGAVVLAIAGFQKIF